MRYLPAGVDQLEIEIAVAGFAEEGGVIHRFLPAQFFSLRRSPRFFELTY